MKKKKKGATTKTGNQHARRVLVEAGWAYRFHARVSKEMQKRQDGTSLKVRDIAAFMWAIAQEAPIAPRQ